MYFFFLYPRNMYVKMGSNSSNSSKVHSYVNNLRRDKPDIIYDNKNNFITKKRMKRMAYKTIANSHKKIVPLNISNAELHFRELDKNKILN